MIYNIFLKSLGTLLFTQNPLYCGRGALAGFRNSFTQFSIVRGGWYLRARRGKPSARLLVKEMLAFLERKIRIPIMFGSKGGADI